MKTLIFGKHPILQPGFCGVMSLYEAKHLAELGHEVIFGIVFNDSQQMETLLARHDYSSIEDLPRFGGDFEYLPIFVEDKSHIPRTDMTIWQSTSASEWKSFFERCRRNTTVFSKNFPKLVPFAPAPTPPSVTAQFEVFDLLTFALKQDLHAARQSPEISEMDVGHKVAYVPRGADPELLHTHSKLTPMIALDTPNTQDDEGIRHFFEPIKQLKAEIPKLVVRSLGRGVSLDFSESLNFRPFQRMYDDFLNPAWLYCVVDYAQSSPHTKGLIHEVDRSWDSLAIYEVQTVEAQMAGAIITGYRENVIPELVSEHSSALFPRHGDEAQIYSVMKNAIDNYEVMSEEVRSRAEKNFTWKQAIVDWDNAARNLIENGYSRSKKTYIAPEKYPVETLSKPRYSRVLPVKAGLNRDEKATIFDLADASRRFVEFGIGGSTVIAAQSRANNIESFETDMNWIEKVKAEDIISENMQTERIRLHHVDIGATKEWGYPQVLTPEICAHYTKSPWVLFPLEDVDTVLVDGRFRVCTAIEAALRTHPHCLIAIDDFYDRPHYSAVTDLLDTVYSLSRMAVFKKGEKWNRLKAFDLSDKYRKDPR